MSISLLKTYAYQYTRPSSEPSGGIFLTKLGTAPCSTCTRTYRRTALLYSLLCGLLCLGANCLVQYDDRDEHRRERSWMGAVPPVKQRNCLYVRSTPSVASPSRLLASPGLCQAPGLCHPITAQGPWCPTSVSPLRADFFAGAHSAHSGAEHWQAAVVICPGCFLRRPPTPSFVLSASWRTHSCVALSVPS